MIRVCRQCSVELTAENQSRPGRRECRGCASANRKVKYEANREKYIQATRDWQSRNPERAAQLKRKWDAENPEYCKAAIQLRLKRQRAAKTAGYSHKAIVAKRALARRLTELCGEPFELDHIVPIAVGGAEHQDNIQVVPRWVNRRKHLCVETWYSESFLISVIENRNPFTS